MKVISVSLSTNRIGVNTWRKRISAAAKYKRHHNNGGAKLVAQLTKSAAAWQRNSAGASLAGAGARWR
jgi:hypothetical protein